MEPQYSLSAYAVVITAALTALSLRGFDQTALGVAIGIVAWGVGLESSYHVRRRPGHTLPHRRRLDAIVRGQLALIGLGGGGGALVLGLADVHPLDHVAPLAQTLIVGLTIAGCAIFVSALVDWYWILPKVSGMTGVAPCTRVGGERFAGVTKIWFFHRAAATTIVTFVLAAVPGYMAGNTGTGGAEGAGWVILGSALAIGYNSVNNGLTAAFRYAFNPRVFVGDMIRVRPDPEKYELADAYAVDVSIQGVKYQVPSADAQPLFLEKGVLLTMDEVAKTRRAKGAQAPCAEVGRCQAVNWYCFRNPNANAPGDHDAAPPAVFPGP